MHSSPGSTDRHTRLRSLLVASIVVVASSTTLIWQQPTGVVLARSKVPFRFMEATVLETQEALKAGTVTSQELVQMYLARIAAYDKAGPAINAMISLNPNALANARVYSTGSAGGATSTSRSAAAPSSTASATAAAPSE